MNYSLLALTILVSQVHAQVPTKHECLPTATTSYLHVSKLGACFAWSCPTTGYVYCGTPTEAAKSSARAATIAKAADPLKSLDTMRSRIVVKSLKDMPEMQPLYDEFKAAIK